MEEVRRGTRNYLWGFSSLSDAVCPVCEKKFSKTPDWVYRRGLFGRTVFLCSYKCMRQLDLEMEHGQVSKYMLDEDRERLETARKRVEHFSALGDKAKLKSAKNRLQKLEKEYGL